MSTPPPAAAVSTNMSPLGMPETSPHPLILLRNNSTSSSPTLKWCLVTSVPQVGHQADVGGEWAWPGGGGTLA